MTEAESRAAIAAALPIAATILPSTATPLERALLAVEIATLAAIDARVVAAVWDPMRCPAVLLPWLAWALSVDVWNPAWSEARKRRVIAASPLVHRLKGTRGAVERALSALDLSTRIVEWWEEEGARRGTFRLEVLYGDGGPIFDPAEQAAGVDAVRAAKPKSRVFTARAVIQAQAPLVLMPLHRTTMLWTVQPYAFDGLVAEGALFAAALPVATLDYTVQPKAP